VGFRTRGGMMLIGRQSESAALEGLLGEVRGGRSSVIVLRGEPGVGKTALLESVVGSASGFRVAKATGVESEAELAFAALQQLLGPILKRLDDLPGPQRDALRAAFGLTASVAPERFLVGLAALSLLSNIAQEQPLLCVVDDAQWLDTASSQTFAFVARRLLAERVAFVIATRASSDDFAGLPELEIGGLDDDDARALLSTVLPGPLDGRVRDLIVEETGGNPLALLELPRGLSVAELSAGFAVPAAEPLVGRIEQSFQRRLQALPADSRRLLLIASAEPLADPDRVWGAARLLGVATEAARPASEAGLMDIDTSVRFRHPLVRSAAYHAATAAERRDVHSALASATNAQLEPDRRAWHLAEAAAGVDEDVASELERSAGRAHERGGLAAAAAFLERAAELTPDRGRRAYRLLLAAGAYLAAGAHGRAQSLLEQSTPDLDDPVFGAQAMRIEGAIRFADGRGGDTPSLLFGAATALREIDSAQAREVLMEAFEAAMWAGALTSGTTLLDVAEAARATPAPSQDTSVASLMLTGYTERLTNGYPAAVEWWHRAVRAHARESRAQQWQGMLWNATGELLDFESHATTARQRVRLVRDDGALANLPVALDGLAWVELLSGRVGAADALVDEAHAIAAAIGAPDMPGAEGILRMSVKCWRGEEPDARRSVDAVTADAIARGQGLATTLAQFQLAILELGHARYEDARIAALNVFEADPMYIGSLSLPDAVEAAVRSGDGSAAHAALERLSDRALATNTPWALGLLARARALIASDEDAEPLYAEALDQLGRSGVLTDVARSRLVYGEWLRRQRRRRDARAQLRQAHEMLQAMGAGAFAHRAEVELLATGERARTRVDETRDQLTPQERQVAQLAAEGESNAEIAAQLFISPHTVAYHLRKVFNKLSVSSRNQLAGALGEPLQPSAQSG
jgi:DNA-binding CsgD family transcriptional regulator